MKHKNFFVLATFILLLTVILGAFGAHGLKPYMVEGGSHTFQTAIRYQFYHFRIINIRYAFADRFIETHCIFFSSRDYLFFRISVFVIGQNFFTR